MSEIRDLKRRINSVKSTQQITKAMKLISAAKLQKLQAAVLASRTYANKLDQVLGHIMSTTRGYSHPLMKTREVKSAGIILFTSDHGLAGGYNIEVINKAIKESELMAPVRVSFICIGKNGRAYLQRQGKTIWGSIEDIRDIPQFSEAQHIAQMAVRLFEEGTFDAIYLAFQEFVSFTSQKPVIKKILPISCEVQNIGRVKGLHNDEYIYEPDPETVLKILVPKYLENMIFEVLREAKASEFGARMVAMTSATDNARKIIDNLTLQFNRARQSAVTTEIAEIIGGADALLGSGSTGSNKM